MRVAIASDEEQMNVNLSFLANVGSVSPYIGLFGTVWGIMTSFQGLSDATQATINAVAPGISEALVATAMGLFAAIPAVLAYNKFASELESISQSTVIFSEELASIFYKQTLKNK
jgi:biopolymer transport protein TolQ